jgi:hypothetical protein
MIRDILLLAGGFLVGGAVTAWSAKVLGFFQKQDKSVAAKLP